jgi:hypothetical protein
VLLQDYKALEVAAVVVDLVHLQFFKTEAMVVPVSSLSLTHHK